MSPLYRLHYAPDNASLCVRIALEELDQPFETALINRSAGDHKSAAYRSLAPTGLIPVLETPEGPVFETAAILTVLAERHAALLPAAGAPGRAEALQWMFWLSNTLHTTLRIMFYPGQYTSTDTAGLRVDNQARLRDQLDLLEHSTTTPWLDTVGATAQGCYLGPMLRWAQIYGGSPGWFSLADFPRLAAFARRTEERAAVQRAAMAEGLGPTPFSAPGRANPPIGSVF